MFIKIEWAKMMVVILETLQLSKTAPPHKSIISDNLPVTTGGK